MEALKRLMAVGWMAWVWPMAAAADDGAAPGAKAPIVTRHMSFSIPFRIEGPEAAPRTSVEVQLHVSEDRGVTWQLASRVSPQAGKFTFRAARDGEYWFMVRTLDTQGVLRPDVPPAPDLIVVVDTAAPQLELHVHRGEAGELHARWKSSDPHLRPETLRIAYQASSTGELWQDVAVDLSRVASGAGSSTGETTWWPDDRRAGVLVRAEVTDAAGNRTPVHARVEALAAPAPRDVAERIVTPLPEPPAPSAPPQSVPWPAQPASSSVGSRGEALPPRMPASFPGGEVLPPPRPEPDSGPLRYTAQARPSPTGVERPVEARPPAADQAVPPAPFNPLAPASPSAAADAGTESNGQAEASAYAGGILPPGVHPRMVNARRFELDYDVDSVGPDGVGKIELWGTRDGGRTWTNYGADDDTRSPFVVTVAGEGLFGFRMVVETTTGLRGALPQPGDLPEVWVGVDTTRPVAELSVAEPGEGSRAGELGIRWKAVDALLAARPITLSFSESAGGPWTVFASGLENTGRYDWRLDNRVPGRIYLRLEVRDEAGNVQVVELAEPVSVDRVRPQGKILNVRPVGS